MGIFAALRIAQGLCMATAFSLTLACPGEMQDYLPVMLAGVSQVANRHLSATGAGFRICQPRRDGRQGGGKRIVSGQLFPRRIGWALSSLDRFIRVADGLRCSCSWGRC